MAQGGGGAEAAASRDYDRAAALAEEIAAEAPPAGADELTRLRHDYLARQLEALRARAAMLTGTRLSFDEESKALYDAVAPTHTEADFESVLAALEAKLPGQARSSTATTSSASSS